MRERGRKSGRGLSALAKPKMKGKKEAIEKQKMRERNSASDTKRKQGRGRLLKREREREFNLLKILQIAPVHNSLKLPTNQQEWLLLLYYMEIRVRKRVGRERDR